MKTYSESLEYQGLVTVLEEAKSIFNATTAKKKEVKAFLKNTQKEATATKGSIYSAYFAFKQAKFNQKLNKLAVRFAKSNMKEYVQAFKAAHKKEAADVKKAASKKGVGNQTDAVVKPVAKTGKVKQAAKTVATKTTKTVAPKAVKKVAKKVTEKPLV